MPYAVGPDVAPFTGAWIETQGHDQLGVLGWSLPSRERGLKPFSGMVCDTVWKVAPFTGAWIETKVSRLPLSRPGVAPFTGAWIETPNLAVPAKFNDGRSLHGSVD